MDEKKHNRMGTASLGGKGVIVGLGNVMRGDEGFSCFVLENLARMPLGHAVQCAYLGDDAKYIGGLMHGSDALLILGAFNFGGPIGKIHRWSYALLQRHSCWMGDKYGSLRLLAQSLAMAELAGVFPRHVSFLWTEAQTTEGYGLSAGMRKPMWNALGIIKQKLFECGVLSERALSISPLVHIDPYLVVRSGKSSVGKATERPKERKKKTPCLQFPGLQ